MKKISLTAVAVSFIIAALAQNDSTIVQQQSDTIKVGGIIIIKKGGKDKEIVVVRKPSYSSNLVTNWAIFDIGFSNINDRTNYASAKTQAFAPGFDKEQFNLRNAKSTNVNIWFFMQRLNLVKHVVNLKYGLGLELNNYRFDDVRVHFYKNPTVITLDPDYSTLNKNKLAADYVTVPLLLNFNATPYRRRGFGFSAGISAGYLYSARQKIKGPNGKSKVKDDFDLKDWKLSYIGELNLGPVTLYGSYATTNMWGKGLDQIPYNVGLRLNSW